MTQLSLIAAPTKLPFTRRFESFLDVIDALGAVDLVVYTPTEWQTYGSTAFGDQKLVQVI